MRAPIASKCFDRCRPLRPGVTTGDAAGGTSLSRGPKMFREDRLRWPSTAAQTPTLADVARAAGVSPATASKALNGRLDVAAEHAGTRARRRRRSSGTAPARRAARAASRRALAVVFDLPASPYILNVLQGVLASATDAHARPAHPARPRPDVAHAARRRPGLDRGPAVRRRGRDRRPHAVRARRAPGRRRRRRAAVRHGRPRRRPAPADDDASGRATGRAPAPRRTT